MKINMKLLWAYVALVCGGVILSFSMLSVEVAVAVKWPVIIFFVCAALRLIYYRTRLPVLRVLVICVVVGAIYYFKSELNLEHNWIPRWTIYEHKSIAGRSIEVQTKTSGEWYKKRIVERCPLLPGIYRYDLYKVLEFGESEVLPMDTSTWKKVQRRL